MAGMDIAQQIAFVIGAALLGWLAGMLINFLADVLPAGGKPQRPACTQCGTPRTWLQLFLWPGACRQCGARRTRRSWVTPLALAAACAATAIYPMPNVPFLAALLTLTYFGVVWVIDQEHRLILHVTSLAGLLIGLAVGTLRQGIALTLYGGLVGLSLLLALYLLGIVFTRLMGRLRGTSIDGPAMGFGDVLLGLVIGLLVGWPDILRSLTFTVLAAGVFAVIYLLVLLLQRRYHMGSAFPYAPFLILGALWVLYL
jgi:prepilin signal peptidase PulO-like enzyme (type II secretory pathway)